MSILNRICCINQVNILFAGSTYLRLANVASKLSTAATNSCAANLREAQSNKSEWTVLYRLPIVRWASAFNRLKIYQGAVSVAGIPATFMLEQAAILPVGSGVTFATVGLTGLATLLFTSFFVQNLIGFIYLHANGSLLKFAYVDYWGRRKDIIMGIDELVPDGAQEKPTRLNFYQIIGTKSNEKFKLKLLQRYGIITKSDVFYTLFY